MGDEEKLEQRAKSKEIGEEREAIIYSATLYIIVTYYIKDRIKKAFDF